MAVLILKVIRKWFRCIQNYPKGKFHQPPVLDFLASLLFLSAWSSLLFFTSDVKHSRVALRFIATSDTLVGESLVLVDPMPCLVASRDA
jgi:hypothetical protein